MPAFPSRSALFPSGSSVSPATGKSLFAAWYDAVTGLLGTDGSQATARNTLGVGAISNRNRFVNGGFDIDQRNEGAAVTVNSGTQVFGPDRWAGIGTSAAGVFTMQRVADASRPGKYRLKLSVTTSDSSIASADIYAVRQRILAKNVRDWNLGTSSAKTVTVSFEIESEVTGTFGIRLTNSAGNRSYVGTFTVNSASTRETKHVTMTLDTSGTWATGDGSIGLEVAITLAAGTNFRTTSGSWQTGNYFTTSSQANFMATVGNDMYLADMQIEEGSISSRVFEELEYSELERRCRFHYRKSFPRSIAPVSAAGTTNAHTLTQVVGASASQSGHRIPFDTPMGGNPIVTVYNPAAAGNQVRNLSTGGAATGTATQGDTHGIVLDFTSPAGTAAGQTCAFHWTAEWEV